MFNWLDTSAKINKGAASGDTAPDFIAKTFFMKRFLMSLYAMLSLTCYGQPFSSNLLVRDKVFTISYEIVSEIHAIRCTSLTSSKDVNEKHLNNITKEIFRVTVSELICLSSHFLTLSDSEKEKLKTEIANGIDLIFDKIQDQKIFHEKRYGVDNFSGVTEEQKNEYIKYREKLLKDQEGLFQAEKFFANERSLKRKVKKLDEKKNKIDSEKKDSIQLLAKLIDSIKILVTDQRKLKSSISESELKLVQLDRLRKHEVAFIGSANVVTSFKVANQSQIGGGFGVIAYRPTKDEFIGLFSVSQANDTISTITGINNSDFAQAVLIPGVRRFSLFTQFRIYNLCPYSYSTFFKKIGFVWNVNVTPYNWAVRYANNNVNDSFRTRAIPVSMDFMFPFHWINIYEPNKDISFSTDLGVSFRYIAGDVSESARKLMLNNGAAFYGGVIGGLSIKYNGFRFQFHAPLIFGKRVDGLTGGQAYASISLITKIFNDVNSVLPKKN